MIKIIFGILVLFFTVGILNSYESEEIPVDINEQLKKVATKEFLETSIQNAIISNNKEEASNYLELAKYLNLSLNSQIIDSLHPSQEKDFVTVVKEKSINGYQGFILGKTDNEEQFYSAIASDFTVIGDAKDFYKEGSNYINGKPYDDIILGLSAIGLGLTASQFLTMGATTPLKVGSSVLKVTAKSGKLSKEFLEVLSQKITKTVDFQLLKKEVDFSSIDSIQKSFKKTTNAFDFSHMRGLTKNLDTIKTNTSLYDTTKLLQYIDTEKDLEKMALITEKYKKSSKTVIKVLGKNILKATKTIIKYSMLFIFELLGLILSLFGFFCTSLFSNIFIRLFKNNFIKKDNI